MMKKEFDRKLIFEDGQEYYGYGFGADAEAVCEIVFNTSMVGYQEILSDPSYADQAVVMTYPLIGNYGMAKDDYERDTPSIGALIVHAYSLADIATRCNLGTSLAEQGISEIYPPEKGRFYVKAPAFSFSKLQGMDAYLSPEMKSTGEAIGYDEKLHRAVYKAMIASGLTLRNYGTVIVSVADEDKEETLPLVRRFYNMGFNIEATALTGEFLKANGIRTRIRRKPSEGSEEVLDSIRAGYVSYVINTRAVLSGKHFGDGIAIRECAAQNNITMLTSLDTVRMLLDVLEEVTLGISTIDGK